ncbi:MAG TPA: AAA family ATPase [Dehalococcoidia bacterium]|nr:AAA family ATPase [Dehalococcoidia bacterium]
MKLVHARISGYKSIEDCELDIDGRVTVLAGKSEAGKTSVLEALSRFSSGGAFIQAELCSWRRDHLTDDHPVITLTFRLNAEDRDRFEALHESLANQEELIVARQLDGDYRLIQPTLEAATGKRPPDWLADTLTGLRYRGNKLLKDALTFIESRRELLPSLASAIDRLAILVEDRALSLQATEEATTSRMADYLAALKELGDALQKVRRTSGDLRGIRTRRSRIAGDLADLLMDKDASWESFETPALDSKTLISALPPIQYFRDKDISDAEDSVSIAALGSSKAGSPAIRGLLKLAGVSQATLESTQRNLQIQQLRDGCEQATQALRSYWSQEAVEVVLDVQGDTLQVFVVGVEGHVGAPSQHSPGFQWFLSFVLEHLLPRQTGAETILLLDEPGTHLHASAQVDLVKQFEGVPDHVQIVYVTHSPFMISKNYPTRVRAIVKNGSSDAERGTQIVNKPYHSPDARGWEPIRTAIGIAAGLSPFTSGENLIVEGVNDQIIVTAAAQRLAEREQHRSAIDLDRTAIMFGGSATEIIPVAKYCHGQKIVCVALFDSDTEGTNAGAKLLKAYFPGSAIAYVAQDSEVPGAIDLESLIDDETYHRLAREAYKEIPGHPAYEKFGEVTFDDVLNEVSPRVETPNRRRPQVATKGKGKVYEEYFRKMDEAVTEGDERWGGFSKKMVAERVADWLRDGPEEDAAEDTDKARIQTLEHFAKLFDAIRARFETSARELDQKR